MKKDFQKQNKDGARKGAMDKGEIIIYQSKGGKVSLDVKLSKETVWLAQSQIASLFNTERSVITKHLRNIFGSKELDRDLVCAKIAHTAADGKIYKTQFYNLDAIISVGYRVNSKRATQFRIWATKALKDHILKGYTINQQRLAESQDKFKELQNAIAFLQEKSQKKELKGQEKEILSLLSNYAKTFSILEQYDKRILKKPKGKKPEFILEYQDCVKIIFELNKELVTKKGAGGLFGNEVNNKFESIAKNLYQTFGGKELYKTIEEKAAHLLYFVVKDHPFLDGNKRIGSFLFVYFLDKNKYLYREIGEKKINDNALAALAILIAESNPKEKEQMIALISQLLK